MKYILIVEIKIIADGSLINPFNGSIAAIFSHCIYKEQFQ